MTEEASKPREEEEEEEEEDYDELPGLVDINHVDPFAIPFPINRTEKFPYIGIFGPGGLLSSVSDSVGEGSSASLHPVDFGTNSYRAGTSSQSQSQGQDHIPFSSLCFNPNDVPANEKIVAIDHILEKILQSMATPDLFVFRSVSPRWKSFTSKILQKRLRMTFYNYKLGSATSQNKAGKSFSELITLFEGPYSEPEFFPVTKFVFVSTKSVMRNIADEVLQNFLNIHGYFIEELSLRFTTDTKNMLHERVVMDYVRSLIVDQAPNLRYLSVRLPARIEWEVENSSGPRRGHTPLRVSDPEYTKIHEQDNTGCNRNLKVVKLQTGFHPSAKVLEVIFQVAPNLDRVVVNQYSYHYFLEPLNRIHLLKYLWFNASDGGLEKFNYERIALATSTAVANPMPQPGEGRIRLRHLTMNVDCHGQWNLDYERRIVRVINILLESSSKSLETLRWDGVAFPNDIRLPDVMPQVWKLHLSNPRNFPFQGGIFPKDFDLSQRFPRLRAVDLFFFGYTEDSDCQTFLEGLNFPPVKTVKHVQVSWRPVKPQHYKYISKIFPQALVNMYNNCP